MKFIRVLHTALLSIITADSSDWRMAVSHLRGTSVVATLLHRGVGRSLLRDPACLEGGLTQQATSASLPYS